jgi:GNAT superfamily N-acetyltransferase
MNPKPACHTTKRNQARPRDNLEKMTIVVHLYEDAASVLTSAGEFLRSRPVSHNLILSLLDGRMMHPEPARYWVASRAGQVTGVVFQSPLTRPALLVPMELDVIEALVEAIASQGIALPGVNGEAATAASFAGQWTERCKTSALPVMGLRLYELGDLQPIRPVEGAPRQAEPSDRDRAIQWVREFSIEIHEPDGDFEQMTDAWIALGQIWLWENNGPVSMAVCRKPVEGVVRVSGVYTPPKLRRRGYAEACIYEVSKRSIEAGYRPILYTDLGNPTSNSIYRRIGYKAASEGLFYRFG